MSRTYTTDERLLSCNEINIPECLSILPDSALMTSRDIMQMGNYKNISHVGAMSDRGLFPKPVSRQIRNTKGLGSKKMWLLGDIREFVKKQKAAK